MTSSELAQIITAYYRADSTRTKDTFEAMLRDNRLGDLSQAAYTVATDALRDADYTPTVPMEQMRAAGNRAWEQVLPEVRAMQEQRGYAVDAPKPVDHEEFFDRDPDTDSTGGVWHGTGEILDVTVNPQARHTERMRERQADMLAARREAITRGYYVVIGTNGYVDEDMQGNHCIYRDSTSARASIEPGWMGPRPRIVRAERASQAEWSGGRALALAVIAHDDLQQTEAEATRHRAVRDDAIRTALSHETQASVANIVGITQQAVARILARG